MADSPASSLSEHGSEEFEEDVKMEEYDSDIDEDADADADTEPMDLPVAPRTKKRKMAHPVPEPIETGFEYDSDISSDTSGEAPSSPTGPNTLGDDDEQQVTICRWRGCTVGDLGNMDELVKHIHDVHVLSRQKKYACEWEGCSRMDATHASGYALRAHMRSHTREKPFNCKLPECDKAFTRSDALAKHMRTVHETEALRPSDPVPRNHSYNTAPLKQKLRLLVKKHEPDGGDPYSPGEITGDNGFSSPGNVELTPEEAAMPIKQLYQLFRRRVMWAEQEGARLKLECEKLEKARKEEWQAKELLLANLIEADLAVEVIESGQANEEVVKNALRIKDEMLPQEMLPINGPFQPFYRQGDTMSVGSLDAAEQALAAQEHSHGGHENGANATA